MPRISSWRRTAGPAFAILGAAIVVLLAPSLASAASAKRAVVTIRTVKVADPGNPSVAIVPFTDAAYNSCADAPQGSSDCMSVGDVGYRYGIGELEITVKQWVQFLNTIDPKGGDRHRLYTGTQSSTRWPKFGQIDRSLHARKGHRYSVATPEWADKPFGFATFLSAARFINSLTNGQVLSKQTSTRGGFRVTTYRVRLSPKTGRGMYDLAQDAKGGATRAHKRGFVVPSQDEWIKAAYFDPSADPGTIPYWKYPTNAGVFGDGDATAPSSAFLDPTTGDVTNAGTQPLANFHASGVPAPTWCPAAFTADECSSVNPFGLDPTAYAKAFQGSLETVGQAKTRSPWGTLDQGGNAVEWTDTITPPPGGKGGKRVWRRLHGGISNAPVYQLWLSAVGLNPEDNAFFNHTYPWIGFRVGVIGNLKPKH